jgi:hypothetical protein
VSDSNTGLDYWQRRDRWADVGRQISALRLAAKARGLKLEEMPDAAALLEEFKRLGRELDRHTR